MTYKENFVVVIKHKGRILRERDNIVSLPFGSEYSILLKNLEARKAVVKVAIDGEDVIDGNSIIVRPNSDLELKGFMKGMGVTNRFKFIKKTEEIVNHRGDRIDDGIVRVEFKFEKKKVTKIIEEKRYRGPEPWAWPYRYTCPYCGCWPCCCVWYKHPDIVCDDSSSFYTYTNGCYNGGDECSVSYNCSTGGFSSGPSKKSFAPNPDEGITVKGSEVNQNFSYGYTDELEEQASVITIVLRGTKNGSVVEKPLTVREKLTCPTCGRKARSNMKYCGNCGTYLE